jgi:hypothetical protein
MADQPLFNVSIVGDLSKPANTLIEKVSDAIGGAFKPYQIIRVANAEAAAAKIRAQSNIEVSALERRALRRFLHEEARKQQSMETVTAEALPLLNDTATPEKVEDDWIVNFFEKSRFISDRDMQQLWARVLAGEANEPGTFAKRTVNLLGDLDKADAELFTRLCGFAWLVDDRVVILIFDYNADEVYKQNGITFEALAHLETLGLIRFAPGPNAFRHESMPKAVEVSYFGMSANLTFQEDKDNDLNIGTLILTRAGEQLAPVSGAKPVDGYYEYVYDRWAAHRLLPKREAQKTPLPGIVLSDGTSPGGILPGSSPPHA